MKIVCPACEAIYQVPEAALATRRTVRCARCGNDWEPLGPAPLDSSSGAQPPPAPSAPQPVAAREASMPELQASAAEAAGFPPAIEADQATAFPSGGQAAEEPGPRPSANLAQGLFAPAPAEHGRSSARNRRAPATGVLVAWAVSLAALVLLAIAAIGRKGEVMRAWPPSTRAYAAVGLYHPPDEAGR